MLISTALVALMTPAVALFYGGMVSEDAAVSTVMLSFGAIGPVTLLWSLVGFSLSFAPNLKSGSMNPKIIGDLSYATLDSWDAQTTISYGGATSISLHTFSLYQLMFAIITSAIIAGAVAGRMKWIWFIAFTSLWHILIYCPLAHWVFFNPADGNPDSAGWLSSYGVIDYAGGMVIHISSGVSAYVLAYLLGGHAVSHRAHNKMLVLLGAALLWFGWFGFNAGSAMHANYAAGLALTNTQLAAAAAMLSWNLLEISFDGETFFNGFPTAIGTATGIVAGLVGITPSAGFVSPMWANFIGFFTALGVFFAPRLLKKYCRVNDTLDCFAVHGIGGMIGSALTGLFANVSFNATTNGANDAANGSFYRNARQLGIQCLGITVTVVFSAVGTAIIFGALWLIAKLLKQTLSIPANLAPDISQHGEKAYQSSTTKYVVETKAPETRVEIDSATSIDATTSA